MKHSTSKNKKQPATPEARCVRYWPTSMRAELDEPIGFRPVCPTSAAYPRTSSRSKVSA